MSRPIMLEKFELMSQEGIVKLKEAKENGKKVVGTYCLFSPQELVIAAGAIPVSLCGTRQDPIPAAEKVLPRNICPLVKSSYGFATTDTCPYFHFSDLIIAETTCDGKKKMYELLSRMKPMHVMELPYATGAAELTWWYNQLSLVRTRLGEETGVEITDERLRDAIALCNEERRVKRELHSLNRFRPAPLSGMDLLTVLWSTGFNFDKQEAIHNLRRLIEEVKEIMHENRSPFAPETPRILVTGCPTGKGSEKLIKTVEESGGSVVCLENCSGYRGLSILVDENPSKDPLLAIAEKYLKTPCSCMSPNPGRVELITSMVREYAVDGVIDLTWQACHTFNIESFLIREHVRNNLGIPFLQVETDYSTSDLESLKIRVSAFLEMIRATGQAKC